MRGISARARSVSWMATVMPRASSGPPNSLMSAPAAKMRSPPVTTTAPGGSAASASAAVRSCATRAPERALTLGLSSVTTATPSSRRSRCTSSGWSAISRTVLPTASGADALQHLVGGRPRVEPAADHVVFHPIVRVAAAQLAGPCVEPRDHDGAQLVAQPSLPASLEQAALVGVRAVVLHGLPERLDPGSGRADRRDNRWPPVTEIGEVEHQLEVAPGLLHAGPIRLVDGEHVGHLEQA